MRCGLSPVAMKASTSTTPNSIIGTPTPRMDGPLKTAGAAEYAADFHCDRLVHAIPVGATIPSGRISKLDATAAESMPGVLLVLHHANIGPLFRTVPRGATNTSEARPASDAEVLPHCGQHVAPMIPYALHQA